MTQIKNGDLPASLRAAIVALERYDAPSRPAMLQLAAHLRGVLEMPHEAEEAVRRCASLDSNGYITEKAAVIAVLRALHIFSPPASEIAVVREWLSKIADLDLEETVAEGGVTAGMVVQQEARLMASKLRP